jgi:hypothetical protein
VKIVPSENPTEEIQVHTSRLTSIKELKESVCKHKNWDINNYKVYDMLGSIRYTEMNDEDIVGEAHSDTRGLWFQGVYLKNASDVQILLKRIQQIVWVCVTKRTTIVLLSLEILKDAGKTLLIVIATRMVLISLLRNVMPLQAMNHLMLAIAVMLTLIESVLLQEGMYLIVQY